MNRIAIIGCGRIAPAHLDGLKELSSRAQVIALCDLNEKLLQERQQTYNIPNSFSSVEELLKWNKFDIAAVLTPPNVRSELCLPVIEAQKHLLVEKPFTHTLDEAKNIVETAKKAGVVVAIDQNFRWIPPTPTLREGILNGKIGKILSFLRVDTVWRDEPKGWRNQASKLALSVMGVHWLDQIRWITGDEGKKIYSTSLISGLLTSVGEDITSTVINLKSGTIATLVHHWASYARHANNSLQIDGTEGTVISKNNELIWIDKDGKQTKEEVSGKEFHLSMTASWTEFLDSIEQGRMPCHSGRDNLHTVALLEGAYRSAEIGEAVEIRKF